MRTSTEYGSEIGPKMHVFVAFWAAITVAYAYLSGDGIPWLAMEDGIIEWATVVLLALACIIGIRRAIRERRVFDGLVALFCLAVLGEEISWGQRLFGFTPPDVFLENNRQQEFNLHNFVPSKSYFLGAVIGYGILMPIAAQFAIGRRVMERIGATPPPVAVLPWAIAVVVLTLWNPHKMTEEWNEGLAAMIFLAAVWRFRPQRHLNRLVSAVVGVTSVVAAATAIQEEPELAPLGCAGQEMSALLQDLVVGKAALQPMDTIKLMNQQAWIAVRHRRVDLKRAPKYWDAACGEENEARDESRRRYGVDPWGLSYWVAVKGEGAERRVYVYSWGPNRREDGEAWNRQGDDLVVSAPFPVR
jgi:hypothetical protein